MQKYYRISQLHLVIEKLKHKIRVKWTVFLKVYGNADLKTCKLCLTEKLWVINLIEDVNLLDKRFQSNEQK